MSAPQVTVSPAEVYVPGVFRCAKCSFVLIQSNLNSDDGTVTARDAPGEPCPNDGSPMWRVTWRAYAKDQIDGYDRLLDEKGERIKALEAQMAATEARWPREFRFGKWTISYDPPPIPTRNCDWHYVHEDDDGAPDGSTARSGSAASAQACLDEIAELVAEMCHPIHDDPPKGQPCAHGHHGCSECSV